MGKLKWTAENRKESGKGASRRLRHQGKVPAIVYGLDKEALSISIESKVVEHTLMDNDAYNTAIDIKIGKTVEHVIIKDLQRNPAKEIVTHIDFQRIDKDSFIVKKIPIEFTGTNVSPGVKIGGLLTILQSSVKVRAKATKLPTKIVVDVSTMEAGSNLRLSDIKLSKGVELMDLRHGNTDYDQSIIKIDKARVDVADTADTADTTDTAQVDTAD